MASIEKRGNHSWRLTVEVGMKAITTDDGQTKLVRDKRTKTIKVEDKALLRTTKKLQEHLEDELHKFKIEIESGEYISPQKMTFQTFVDEEWDKKYSIKELSPLTRKTYKHHIKNHIMTPLGHLRLDEIKTMHLVDLLDSLGQEGARKDKRGEILSDRTIQYIYSVLRNLFSVAIDWKLIKHNPMLGIKKPKAEKKKAKYYEADEAHLVINALSDELMMWRMFFLGALLGGFRRGELIALEWPDVIFDKNAIFVHKSISLVVKGEPCNKYEKSTKGNEEEYVDMPKWYMDELKTYHQQWLDEKEKLGDTWEGGENQYVFHGGRGKSLYHTTPSTRWRKFILDHKLRYIRLHDLRHTSATLLIEEGASLKAIQERLRHKQQQTTSDIYAHVTKKVSRDLADKFDRFSPSNNLPKSQSPEVLPSQENQNQENNAQEHPNYVH